MEGEKLTYITTSNLYWDRFELSTLKEMLFTKSEIEKCTASKGDLLVCEGGDIGRAAIWQYDYDIRIQNHIHRLRGLGEVNHRLFLFWFMYLKTMGLIGGKGIGLMGLSSGELDKLEIPVPPLREQDSIVRKIDNLFIAIQKLDEDCSLLMTNIEQSKSMILDLALHGKLVPQDPTDEPAIELLKHINPAFKPSDNLHYGELPLGWEMCTLGEISNYGKCISVPVTQIKDSDWILELEDIEKDSGRILSVVQKNIRKPSGTRHSFKKGQILYSKLRTYLNKVLIAPKDGYCTTEIIPISTEEGVNAEYLTLVLRSPYFLDYTEQCGHGVKMPRLGTNDARKAKIPLPPINEQERIVLAVNHLYNILDAVSLSVE